MADFRQGKQLGRQEAMLSVEKLPELQVVARIALDYVQNLRCSSCPEEINEESESGRGGKCEKVSEKKRERERGRDWRHATVPGCSMRNHATIDLNLILIIKIMKLMMGIET